jgi:NAD(P)H dehydrogenase (quinone)
VSRTTASKVLWITGHPKTDSLNHQLMKEGSRFLGRHAEVTVVDLYELGWNPVLDPEELDRASLASADVIAQQRLLREADILIVQFPMWWHSMPAIVKGWFDRVFAHGFAFGIKDPATGRTLKYGDGGLAGRRALTIVTAGDRSESFGPRGINGDIELLLFPLLHGTFWYSGMAALRPHLIAGTDVPGWNGAEYEKSRLIDRLGSLDCEMPIPYRSLASGDYREDRTLHTSHATGELGLDLHIRSS